MDPIIGAEDPEDPLGVDVGAVVTDVGPSVGARVVAGDGKQPLHAAPHASLPQQPSQVHWLKSLQS
jgi:hypothetical protein